MDVHDSPPVRDLLHYECLGTQEIHRFVCGSTVESCFTSNPGERLASVRGLSVELVAHLFHELGVRREMMRGVFLARSLDVPRLHDQHIGRQEALDCRGITGGQRGMKSFGDFDGAVHP